MEKLIIEPGKSIGEFKLGMSKSHADRILETFPSFVLL